MKRRAFVAGCAAVILPRRVAAADGFNVAELDRARVIRDADRYLAARVVTITAASSPRSAGGVHDFFSEGDYWWPNPKDPEGPYIQRDGMSNPGNFVEHRKLLMKLSVQAPALTAAWKLTGEHKFADHAAAHIRAWFVDASKRMNPSLQFAQAIHGRTTGRGTGIIDTIHLVEVVQSVPLLVEAKALSKEEGGAVRKWFSDYLSWMTTSKAGMEERDAKNNHATCWLMQVAAFARLTRDERLLAHAADRFRSVIVPGQIDPDGSQPLELNRTKPYGYCLFNLEALATLCHIVSESGEDLWKFKTADGRSISKAIEFMFPFIRDKSAWNKPPDVMYFESWPMRQEALLFGGLAYGRADYLDVWKRLPASSEVDEVIRNYFIRQPVLWVA